MYFAALFQSNESWREKLPRAQHGYDLELCCSPHTYTGPYLGRVVELREAALSNRDLARRRSGSSQSRAP